MNSARPTVLSPMIASIAFASASVAYVRRLFCWHAMKCRLKFMAAISMKTISTISIGTESK